MASKPEQSSNPLADVDNGIHTLNRRESRALIYDSVMRAGGEPYGAPFEKGLATLTEKIVKWFKVRSFFGFETLEKVRPRNRRNKFTRAGAAPFVGSYRGTKK